MQIVYLSRRVQPRPDGKSRSGWLERLQTNGYRLTAPRLAVVEVAAGGQYVLNLLECMRWRASVIPGWGW